MNNVDEYEGGGYSNHSVSFKKDPFTISCDCALCENKGILCAHSLFVLKENDIRDIPRKYILDRWKKDIVIHALPTNPTFGRDLDNPCDRYKYICSKGCVLAELDCTSR